jgi:exonuclease SbcD
MIHVLHLGDIHIGTENYGRIDPATGVNSRVLDFLHRLDEAIGVGLENDVDLVIFSGDIYHSRDPNSTYRREFAKRIKRLSDAGVPVVLLVGNHDQPSVHRRASSIEVFRTLAVPGVYVADKEMLHRIETKRGPIQVATAPYPSKSRLLTRDEYRNKTIDEIHSALQEIISENIRLLAEQIDPTEPAILVAHVSVAGAKMGSERNIMLGYDPVVLKSDLLNPAFDYVALGHIHKHQNLNEGGHPPLVYCGSIERVDFGEESEDKGVVLARVTRGSTEVEFVPLHARPFITIRVDAREEADPTEVVLTELASHDLQEAVVRLFVRLRPEQAPVLDEARVRRALAEAFFVAAIQRDVESDALYRTRFTGDFVEQATPLEMLERYMVSKEIPEDRAQVMIDYARRIFAEVEE